MTKREWEIIGIVLLFVFVVPILAVLGIGQYLWWRLRNAPD